MQRRHFTSHEFSTAQAIEFNKCWNLVRDQGVGGSNPLIDPGVVSIECNKVAIATENFFTLYYLPWVEAP
jgi:hypothetical protein